MVLNFLGCNSRLGQLSTVETLSFKKLKSEPTLENHLMNTSGNPSKRMTRPNLTVRLALPERSKPLTPIHYGMLGIREKRRALVDFVSLKIKGERQLDPAGRMETKSCPEFTGPAHVVNLEYGALRIVDFVLSFMDAVKDTQLPIHAFRTSVCCKFSTCCVEKIEWRKVTGWIEYSAEMLEIWGRAAAPLSRRRKGAKGQHNPHVYIHPHPGLLIKFLLLVNDKSHQFAVVTRAPIEEYLSCNARNLQHNRL